MPPRDRSKTRTFFQEQLTRAAWSVTKSNSRGKSIT